MFDNMMVASSLRQQVSEVLPLAQPWPQLFTRGGVPPGSTVNVHGSPALLAALLGAASAAGSWTAVVGAPWVNAAALVDMGAVLTTCVFVPTVSVLQLPETVAALLDGMRVVVTGQLHRLGAADLRRLTARARHHEAVIVGYTLATQQLAADYRLSLTESCWLGLERGHGRLRARQVTVVLTGRRVPGSARRAQWWLPSPHGGCEQVVGAGVRPIGDHRRHVAVASLAEPEIAVVSGTPRLRAVA